MEIKLSKDCFIEGKIIKKGSIVVYDSKNDIMQENLIQDIKNSYSNMTKDETSKLLQQINCGPIVSYMKEKFDFNLKGMSIDMDILDDSGEFFIKDFKNKQYIDDGLILHILSSVEVLLEPYVYLDSYDRLIIGMNLTIEINGKNQFYRKFVEFTYDGKSWEVSFAIDNTSYSI